ncbi:hypothetical protein B5P43_22510 [Bacillus sp. SRB_336]|nr:hypothetical protein B5P43_22510 [Bacillus sp. SRB_336]
MIHAACKDASGPAPEDLRPPNLGRNRYRGEHLPTTTAATRGATVKKPARSRLSRGRDTALRVRRRYSVAAMAGVAAYVGVDAVLQRLPPHYSLIRDAESNLAVGPYGWIMNVNFIGRAATTLCLVRAVLGTGPASPLRTTGAALLGLGGACSGVLAFFPTDIPGVDAPAAPGLSATTWVGAVHLAVTGVGFLAAFAGTVVLTAWLRTCPRLRRTSAPAAGFCALTTAGLGALGLAGRHFPAYLGLAERIALAGILGWAFSVAAGLRALAPAPAGPAIPVSSAGGPRLPR